MALKRGGLGRGLDSLIPDKKKEQTAKQSASSKDEVKAAKKTSGKKAGTKKKNKPEDENDTAAQSKKGKPSDESANESVLSENETRKADEINIEAGNETGASDLTQAELIRIPKVQWEHRRQPMTFRTTVYLLKKVYRNRYSRMNQRKKYY